MRRAGAVAERVGDAARRIRPGQPLAPWAGGALAVALLAMLMMTPPAHGAVRLAARLAAAVTTLSRHAPRAPQAAVSARLVQEEPAVGALFHVTPAGLGTHFCTASVVDSPHRDLVITAAHCIGDKTPGEIAFVPGYHDGVDPYGVWFVSRVVMDAQWRRSHNPDHDVAFLVMQQQDGSTGVQALTGGERLRRLHRRDQRRAVPGPVGLGDRAGHGHRRDRRLRAGRGSRVGVLLAPVRLRGAVSVPDRGG
jgi:hypothetical protein